MSPGSLNMHRQLLRVREALRGKVTVLLDERDRREIDKQVDESGEESLEVKYVEVGRHVRRHSPFL